MALNPGYHEQDMIADALSATRPRLSARERRAELVVGGLRTSLCGLALLSRSPPELQLRVRRRRRRAAWSLSSSPSRAEFDTGSGFTVPSQLAFVPLLFTLPPALVPLAVPCSAGLLAKLPASLRGELRAVRLLAVFGNSWFVIGPALVLVAVRLRLHAR